MILAAIILVLVGACAFFHYTQGFFSATISAMLAILSAVLAFSYHEVIVEKFLGGRFGDVAHGMALAVLFAGIYFLLRTAFDRMVPGNVRFPVIVDKVGGAAMGLVAGVFAGGVLAIVAQYLPLKPDVAGYSRYATMGTREVTIPPEASQRGTRADVGETWDALKSETPGQFDESDRQGLIVPLDDVVVNTVQRLSDGGSLSGSQPLAEAHPDFLREVFAQRLGVQPKATRVAARDAITSVDLFRVDQLARKDHEYKEVRQRPQDTSVLKPRQNEVLVVARVLFNKSATDKDSLVRFSPASLRLVTRKGSGADAQRVDYYPVGTVDKASLLYVSALDDYLFVDSKEADRGADFAFVIDKSSLEGQGQQLKFPEGTFIEFKRLARQDLEGKTIKPPSAYKPSDQILILRKRGPKKEDAPTPTTPTPTAAAPAGGGAAGRDKLIGNWAGASDTGSLMIEFRNDGSLTVNNTPKGGLPTIGQGTWEVVQDKSTADTLVINRTLAGTTTEYSIKFTDDSNITLTSQGRPPLQLQKR